MKINLKQNNSLEITNYNPSPEFIVQKNQKPEYSDELISEFVKNVYPFAPVKSSKLNKHHFTIGDKVEIFKIFNKYYVFRPSAKIKEKIENEIKIKTQRNTITYRSCRSIFLNVLESINQHFNISPPDKIKQCYPLNSRKSKNGTSINKINERINENPIEPYTKPKKFAFTQVIFPSPNTNHIDQKFPKNNEAILSKIPSLAEISEKLENINTSDLSEIKSNILPKFIAPQKTLLNNNNVSNVSQDTFVKYTYQHKDKMSIDLLLTEESNERPIVDFTNKMSISYLLSTDSQENNIN